MPSRQQYTCATKKQTKALLPSKAKNLAELLRTESCFFFKHSASNSGSWVALRLLLPEAEAFSFLPLEAGAPPPGIVFLPFFCFCAASMHIGSESPGREGKLVMWLRPDMAITFCQQHKQRSGRVRKHVFNNNP
jgi:hypothetical protein